MDRNQVRGRIIEAAHTIKQKLSERGVRPDEAEQSYDYHDGVATLRHSAFWSREQGYKYIDDIEEHLRRFFQCLDLLNPRQGDSVFEIGPGNCYFLFMCRELCGCRVAGVEWKEGAMPGKKKAKTMPFHDLKMYAYQLFRDQFGLEDVVRHQIVTAYQAVAFDGRHDAIVATRAMFNCHWGEGEYRYWLRDCHEHLAPGGRLMVHFNKIDPESLAALPFLLPDRPLPGNEKLTIVSREALGQHLTDHPASTRQRAQGE